jgi:hypothetical protein
MPYDIRFSEGEGIPIRVRRRGKGYVPTSIRDNNDPLVEDRQTELFCVSI